MKKIVSAICLSILLIAIIASLFAMYPLTSISKSNDSEKQILISERSKGQKSERSQFDLESIMTGKNGRFNTCMFSGIITKIVPMKVEWVDDHNEAWGPFNRTIITVNVTDRLQGNQETIADSVNILYLGVLEKNGKEFPIDIEKEYFFMNCWILDENYYSFCAQEDPLNLGKDKSLDEADVIIGGVWNSIFPICDGKISVYRDYFADDENVLKKAYDSEGSSFEKMISLDVLSSEYLILDQDVFNEAILTLSKKYN